MLIVIERAQQEIVYTNKEKSEVSDDSVNDPMGKRT